MAEPTRYFLLSLLVQVIGIGVTVLIMDNLAERRADRRAEDARKRQLIDDAASTNNEIAKNAVHQLGRKGWLTGEDGLLKGADLEGANLQGANLENANLEAARLIGANLQGANLAGTNLHWVDFWNANLEAANLSRANLHEADFWNANLQGAELGLANLQAADLRDAKFDDTTILPDGNHWSPETDLNRFTDPPRPSGF